MSKRIKVGFIGVGAMGQAAHLRNYATLSEECEIVACADLSPDLSRAVATRYGIPRHYTSGAELLANEELDAIVASQPFSRHGILVTEIAEKGVPIFTEKPIAASVHVGEKIVETLRNKGTWLMVGYHKRSDPATEYAVNAIKELKASGEIGKLKYVRITMPPGDYIAGGFNDLLKETHNRNYGSTVEWDSAPPEWSEATYHEYINFVNFYIHQVNLLRYLLGESFQVSYADPAQVLLVAHSESGIPCIIEMTPYQSSVDWQETALVGFQFGYVKLDLPAPLVLNRPGEVEIFKDPGNGVTPTKTRPILPSVHAMRNQALNFIRAVRGEAPAPCLAEEALEDLKVARKYLRLLKGV